MPGSKSSIVRRHSVDAEIPVKNRLLPLVANLLDNQARPKGCCLNASSD